MLVGLLESVGKALVRSAFVAMLSALCEEQAKLEPRQWYSRLQGSDADPVNLWYLDQMDRADFEANLHLQHERR